MRIFKWSATMKRISRQYVTNKIHVSHREELNKQFWTCLITAVIKDSLNHLALCVSIAVFTKKLFSNQEYYESHCLLESEVSIFDAAKWFWDLLWKRCQSLAKLQYLFSSNFRWPYYIVSCNKRCGPEGALFLTEPDFFLGDRLFW